MAPTVRQLQQNLVNTNHAPLEVTSLLETELDEEKIAHLLGKTIDTLASENPFTIGLSGGYTSSGILSTLAVAVGSKVFLIQFRSKTKSSDAAVTEARKLLTDYILCRPQAGTTLYAFDLAPLALQLYGDHSLLIENGVDVQSGCACADQRDPVAATKFATTSTKVAKIYSDNIRDAFSSAALDQAKPETSRALGLRAWLASFVPTLGDMEERFREVPKINTKSMPADVSVCRRSDDQNCFAHRSIVPLAAALDARAVRTNESTPRCQPTSTNNSRLHTYCLRRLEVQTRVVALPDSAPRQRRKYSSICLAVKLLIRESGSFRPASR